MERNLTRAVRRIFEELEIDELCAALAQPAEPPVELRGVPRPVPAEAVRPR